MAEGVNPPFRVDLDFVVGWTNITPEVPIDVERTLVDDAVADGAGGAVAAPTTASVESPGSPPRRQFAGHFF